MNRARSLIWDHFTKISDVKAKCNFCSVVFSYKGGSTANLLRHVRSKHPSINVDQDKRDTPAPQHNQNRQSTSTECSGSIVPSTSTGGKNKEIPPPKKRKYVQQHISDVCRTPISQNTKQKLDFQLVKMIAMDYQPFSIVESDQFQNFIKMLNPLYALPSRKTISNNLVAHLYNKVADEIKTKLEKADAVTVTTDGWTSISNESYISVTIHYIDDECNIKSFLLECFKYCNRHTAQNLADEIKRVLCEWKVERKVVAVVTDNAANITAAIRLCGWKHLRCYAHTLNLIVQTALKEIELVQNKVKSIVTFFKRSPQAAAKLREIQKQMSVTELTLKQDVPTRWNSTFELFSRILKVREPLVSTLAIVNFEHEQLSQNDWAVINESCNVLKFFLEITSDMSAEKNVTVSKIIVLSNLLSQHFANLNSENMSIECKNMINVIREQIEKRFVNIEDNMLLAESTLLDPRFKKHGFQKETSFEKTKTSIIEICKSILLSADKPSENVDFTEKEEASIWDVYDKKTAHLKESENITASCIVEVNQYLQEPLLKRTNNPLEWWQNRKNIYPRLFEIMKKKLCVVATSVPSERVFSKCGQIITERRARLSANKVSKLVYLNFNLNYVDV